MLAYAALGGNEGIINPSDLKVVPLAVPGAGIRVSAGGCGILNRSPGSAEQAYTGRNPTSDTVAIAATGSGGGRSDLIVVRVEDPGMSGFNYQEPGDVTVGPYIFTRVIPNVPAGTTDAHDLAAHANDSCITIARVDMPASTGTVQAGMITDLRDQANPRSQRVCLPGTIQAQTVTLSNDWQNFPAGGVPNVFIPKWATHCTIRYETTYRAAAGAPYFEIQAFINPDTSGANLFQDMVEDATQVLGGDQSRHPLLLPTQGVFAIPTALRGTTTRIMSRVKGANAATVAAGSKIMTNPTDYMFADITFMEAAL
jgi:hypothetical protein